MRKAQRGRGRSGRAASERGRKRRRGPSGGGTLRRKSPQEGHRPSMPMGWVASARIQCPRASQSGLMHCTVSPGRYCMVSPSGAAKRRPSCCACLTAPSPGKSVGPLVPTLLAAFPTASRLARGSAAGPGHGQGTRGNSTRDGAHSAFGNLRCQEKNTTRYCGKVAAVKIVTFHLVERVAGRGRNGRAWRCSVAHAGQEIGTTYFA